MRSTCVGGARKQHRFVSQHASGVYRMLDGLHRNNQRKDGPMSLKTPIGILSFPQLFTPRALTNTPNSEPRFSLSLLLDQKAQATPEFKELKKACAQAIDE